MKNANLIIALVVGVVVGLVIGRTALNRDETSQNGQARQTISVGTADTSAEAKRAAASREPIYKVEGIEQGWAKGPDDALVTIVEWSNFQCGFCARVQSTIDELKEHYGDKLRVVFMHMPMPNMPQANIAAQAAEAAGAQGKFWEYREKLFENTRALNRPDLERYARELGLDMARFRADLDNEVHKPKVDALLARGQALGVTGTPAFFINGRSLVGAQPVDNFKSVIDQEIRRAEAVMATGVKPVDLYATLIADGQASTSAARPQAPARPQRPQFGRATAESAHSKGPADALVTIVEFSNVQCGFCARVRPTVERIKKEYGDKVRVVFKHQTAPGPGHLAAQAGEAAGEQGKFFEFMDKVFGNMRQIDRGTLESHAQELGLDMSRFRSALDEGRFASRVDEHRAEAMRIGARGTPTFFINGRLVAGAQPFESFKSVIDEEIELAERLVAEGTGRAQLYERVLDENEKKHGTAAPPPIIRPAAHDTVRPAAPQPARPAQAPDARVEVDSATAIFRGPENAEVTIIEFSNFACGFCGRVQPTLQQLMRDYDGQIRIGFMHRPMNPASEIAAEATMAAHAQGKFFEYKERLFANMGQISRPDLERHAEAVGLDMDAFRSALDSRQYKEAVERHVAAANAVGATGTPTFFINGQRFIGAQPVERFKAIIDAELEK